MIRVPVAAARNTRNAVSVNDGDTALKVLTRRQTLSFSFKNAMVRFQASWAASL